MLKETDAYGQIALGEEYAGMLFDVIVHAGGRVELVPVTAGATAPEHPAQIVQAPDGWVPPGGYDACTRWALDNREAIEAYARQTEEEGTAADQLQRFLIDHPEYR